MKMKLIIIFFLAIFILPCKITALELKDEKTTDSSMIDIIESYDKELARLYYELENEGAKSNVSLTEGDIN